MSDTTTPNLGLTKPAIGASRDSWGGKINGDLDILDSSVLAKTGGTLTGDLTIGSTGTPHNLTVNGTSTLAGAVTVNGATQHNGAVTIGSNTAAQSLYVNGPNASTRALQFETAGSPRWSIFVGNTSEGGTASGSDLYIASSDNNGTGLAVPFAITRSSGLVTINSVTFSSTGAVTMPLLTNAANDAAAAAAGVAVGQLYRNGSVVMQRTA